MLISGTKPLVVLAEEDPRETFDVYYDDPAIHVTRLWPAPRDLIHWRASEKTHSLVDLGISWPDGRLADMEVVFLRQASVRETQVDPMEGTRISRAIPVFDVSVHRVVEDEPYFYEITRAARFDLHGGSLFAFFGVGDAVRWIVCSEGRLGIGCDSNEQVVGIFIGKLSADEVATMKR